MTRPGAVYRIRDESGDLLYVGCTINPTQRLQEHARKPWGNEIASVELEWFEDRAGAAEAEFAAICNEAPRYNVARVLDRMHDPCLYADVVALVEESSKTTLQVVGKHLGVTRERVRQHLVKGGYDYAALMRERRLVLEEVRECRKAVDRQHRRRNHPLCAVCKTERCSRQDGKTCGPRCAEAWLQLLTTTDRHRIYNARSILRRADREPPSKVAWAKRMLSDNPPPKNRRYRTRNSHRAEVLEAIGAAPPPPPARRQPAPCPECQVPTPSKGICADCRDRQLAEVARLRAQGLSLREIAVRLEVNPATLHNRWYRNRPDKAATA